MSLPVVVCVLDGYSSRDVEDVVAHLRAHETTPEPAAGQIVPDPVS